MGCPVICSHKVSAMCEFLRVTSAAALTLFFSTPGFAASDQPSHEPHALQAVADSLGANGDTAGREASLSISRVRTLLAGQLRDLIETTLQQYVPRQQDRASVEAFYSKRDFAPIWIRTGRPLPRAQQAADFLQGVAADGLDPNDYPTPRLLNADPADWRRKNLR